MSRSNSWPIFPYTKSYVARKIMQTTEEVHLVAKEVSHAGNIYVIVLRSLEPEA